MFSTRSLLVIALIVIVIFQIAIRLIRTHLFSKIDPDQKYHRVNWRGHSSFNPYNSDTPKEMFEINKITSRVTYLLFGLLVVVFVLMANIR
jgi:NADH:ubiquinone oxidoreductase subunit 3 (subunit A)